MESENDDGKVVHGFLFHGSRHDSVYRVATSASYVLKAPLVHARSHLHVLGLLAGFINDKLCRFLCTNAIEDAVTADEDEVQVIFNWHDEYLGIRNDALRVSPILLHLGHAVTKRS